MHLDICCEQNYALAIQKHNSNPVTRSLLTMPYQLPKRLKYRILVSYIPSNHTDKGTQTRSGSQVQDPSWLFQGRKMLFSVESSGVPKSASRFRLLFTMPWGGVPEDSRMPYSNDSIWSIICMRSCSCYKPCYHTARIVSGMVLNT